MCVCVLGWLRNRRSNIHCNENLEEKNGWKSTEIMIKNPPSKLVKDKQTEETAFNNFRPPPLRRATQHIIVEIQKTKDHIKLLKVAREKSLTFERGENLKVQISYEKPQKEMTHFEALEEISINPKFSKNEGYLHY